VLLGGLSPSPGPLPPLGLPPPPPGGLPPVNARSGSAGAKPSKSLAPRIAELGQALAAGQPAKAKAACSELAMLAAASISACQAVVEAKIEPQLSKVLLKEKDPMTQCWAMSVLSNCAINKASRERQQAAIPALCKLIMSPNPEVQHAAALHLALLSRSSSLATAFASNNKSMQSLYSLEKKTSDALKSPAFDTLRMEASQYARWALRSAQGRHYKPAFVPKSQEQLDYEATVAIQARVRSSFVANGYRNEMKARRAAATIVQASYRGHGARSAVAQQIMIEGPAAALLQSVIRGRKQRKKDRSVKEDKAATKVQAMTRGRKARGYKKSVSDGAQNGERGSTPHNGRSFNIYLECADGDMRVPIAVDSQSSIFKLGFKIETSGEPVYMSLGVPVFEDVLGAAPAEEEPETEFMPVVLFCSTLDGDQRMALHIEYKD
jgi:hypothetical protein